MLKSESIFFGLLHREYTVRYTAKHTVKHIEMATFSKNID